MSEKVLISFEITMILNGFFFQRFQGCLDWSCDMWPSIVMLEDNFVVSLLVLQPFHLKCSAQTHQLRSIPIPCDGFSWFQQLIIHHTELVSRNVEHNLGTVRHVRVFPMIFCAWDYHSGPIFRCRSQCHVKTSSDSGFEAAVHKQRNIVQHLSASTRTEPNFLASESFPWP